MALLQDDLRSAAGRLYSYLEQEHWDGQALVGPDPGVRFNARIWRFLKSYTRGLDWKDNLAYIQAQKYWITCNLMSLDAALVDSAHAQKQAQACASFLLDRQSPEGYWPHPNPEWAGRIATVEGNYGAMGLLEVYRRWGDDTLLSGAQRWYDYVTNIIGLRTGNGHSAINYFAYRGEGSVPNVSVSALHTFALLADATGEGRYLEHRDSIVRWLHSVQLETGELPYHTTGPDMSSESPRTHFLCYQYNAFELVNLIAYYELTGDTGVWELMEGLADFVAAGVTDDGACRYDCSQDRPEVSYYTGAAAAALTQASAIGVADYASLGERSYRHLLMHQVSDGSMMFYSRANYGILADKRSYPRYLAMTLHMMLLGTGILGARSGPPESHQG